MVELNRGNVPKRPTITVWIYDPIRSNNNWFPEPFLADDVFQVGLKMALEDYSVKYAVYRHDPPDEPWMLATLDGDGLRERTYPSREAAEMVAIHNG